MPSDISKQIVQQIYSDDKSKAIDSINDALSAHSYDVIQAHKIALAQNLGFELDDTAQDSADEIAASMPDNTDIEPEDVEVDTTATEASAEQQPEDTPEEENETDS
jgi:hypothetical protein